MERDSGLPFDGPVSAPLHDAKPPAESPAAPASAETGTTAEVGTAAEVGSAHGQVPAAIPASARPPGVAETIGGALDLALAASAGIRRASLYTGFVTLLIAGPAIVLFMALIRDLGGLDNALRLVVGQDASFDRPEDAASGLRFATFFAFIGVAAISLEGQIMAATIVGGAATGRRIGMRGALRMSRRVFWSIAGAAVAVGILDRIVSTASAEIAFAMTASADGSTIAAVSLAGLAVMPFVYYQSGIILGGVGGLEALRRSTRLARARWRLALLVALAGAVLSVVEVFALGAGLDLVVRVAGAAGLGMDGSPQAAFATVAVVLVCVIAIGSLLVTIAALVAAPQMYVFYKLTGYSAGLDRVQPSSDGSAPRLRLVTRPMLALIVIGAVFGLLGLMSL